MTWRVKIEQDEDGSLIVPLPDELLAELDVGVGDSLYLVEEYVGNPHCIVLSKTAQTPDRADAPVDHWNKLGVLQPARMSPALIDKLVREAEISFEFAGLPFQLRIKPRVKLTGLDFDFIVKPVEHSEARRQACHLIATELYVNRPPAIKAAIEELRTLYPPHLSC